MTKLLDSVENVFVDKGFVYLPLLFDQSVEQELSNQDIFEIDDLRKTLSYLGKARDIVKIHDDYYIKSFSLKSFLDGLKGIDPKMYDLLKQRYLGRYKSLRNFEDGGIDNKLRTIIYEVMPYFITIKDGFKRRKPEKRELMEMACRGIEPSEKYMKQAETVFDSDALESLVSKLESAMPEQVDMPEGLIHSVDVEQWIHNAIEPIILMEKKNELKSLLEDNKKYMETNKRSIAALLQLQRNPKFEIDGFGIMKMRGSIDDDEDDDESGQLVVYKHTGEYVLKDFNGKLYHFPDCRVAVKIGDGAISGPFIMEKYKHPFLPEFKPRQSICTGEQHLSDSINAKGIINNLEKGLKTMLNGYFNYERFNGYKFLDGHNRHGNEHVEFSDYEIKESDPRLKSGEVIITNNFIELVSGRYEHH